MNVKIVFINVSNEMICVVLKCVFGMISDGVEINIMINVVCNRVFVNCENIVLFFNRMEMVFCWFFVFFDFVCGMWVVLFLI